MKGVFKTLAPLAVAAIFSVAAFGQEASPPHEGMAQQAPGDLGPGGPGGPGRHGQGFRGMELLGLGGMHGGKVVKGAPFSAVSVTTMNHLLADGTNISNTIKVTLYRDSQGRFRKEGSMPFWGNTAGDQPHSFIVISDPVAAKNYLLNPEKKVARVGIFRARGPKDGKGATPGANSAAPNVEGGKERGDNANLTKISLGTQTINGVSAEGTRYTRLIPTGEIGNDKPITITREVWYSNDLQMVVQSKHSDPRFGDSTYTLTNIQRTEPAANLFSVPSDYTLQQDAGHHVHGRRGEAPPPPPQGEPAPSPNM
ncbi:MAG: hypothetical protein JSS69_15150 [Acidobacteria bacterium]|nr:hypothetical protein [Acidobacteriota bacterium]MBS1867249.1 hypothetical protein [Acidobacteriota bacterium]